MLVSVIQFFIFQETLRKKKRFFRKKINILVFCHLNISWKKILYLFVYTDPEKRDHTIDEGVCNSGNFLFLCWRIRPISKSLLGLEEVWNSNWSNQKR